MMVTKGGLYLTLIAIILIICLFLFLKPKEKRVIVCWGDSLTAPSYSNNIKSKLYQLYKGLGDWPEFLQRYLGYDYKVINSGVSGENTLGIMLRQGSLPLLVGKDILFCAKQGTVTHIASKNDSLFEGMLGGVILFFFMVGSIILRQGLIPALSMAENTISRVKVIHTKIRQVILYSVGYMIIT